MSGSTPPIRPPTHPTVQPRVPVTTSGIIAAYPAAALGDPLVELRNVTVLADDGHKILDDVSLTLHEREILGLVFSHGVGKSTLLRVASGFFRPASGEVLYRGRNIEALSFEEELRFHSATGFVFQNGGLLVNTPVFDNVALPLRYQGVGEAEVEKKVMAALERVSMAAIARKFPWEITVPRQKLVSVARCLVRKPDVIFYDNFFKGTDVVAWQTITRLVRQLRATDGLAWLLVLETDPSTYPIADRLVVIEDGKVIDTQRPQDLRSSKDVRISRLFRTIDHDLDEADGGPVTGGQRP